MVTDERLGKQNPPRVWVLGAGFSKPLGGPLIKDLLAMREKAMFRSLFPAADYQDLADEQYRVRVFYDYGRERGYWDHAEQFLDLAESAAYEQKAAYERATTDQNASTRSRQSHGATLLESMLKVVGDQEGEQPLFDNIEYLARAARRALAVDCSVFLRSAQLDTERWQPYKDWAKGLHANDTVITFNYDYVPELLAAQTSSLRIVSPVNSKEDIGDARDLGVPVVLKLHGSVTWVAEKQSIKVLDVQHADLGNPRMDVVIGVPGPGKRRIYRESLQQLRGAAMAAIREAHRLVFVGYRFPPTDGDTRRDILSAIRRNRQKGFFSVKTVLGPSVQGDDSTRLLELLRTATDAHVTQVPLYAEDYLSLMGLDDGNA